MAVTVVTAEDIADNRKQVYNIRPREGSYADPAGFFAAPHAGAALIIGFMNVEIKDLFCFF